MIPYGHHTVTEADIESVVRVLRSDFLTQGPVVPQFEKGVASRVNAKFAVAVNSATSALHLACLALGLRATDRLWTVPNSFVASANCGRYCGADIDFVDIDPLTWNISVCQLRKKLQEARSNGSLPKVLVPVHFAGHPPEQEDIWELAQEFGFRVLEDASHAIGAYRNGEPVGSCRWSDITVFSFHPVKIITSGEGGMAMTNSQEIAERMRMLRSHGTTRDPSRFIGTEHCAEEQFKSKGAPAWYYEQQMLGFNYRMTEIHAALGLSQLDRVGEYVKRRNALAIRYHTALEGLPLQLPNVQRENTSAFHLYVVRLRLDSIGKGHRDVFDELRKLGVGVNLHYIPIHLQPYYRRLGFLPHQHPEAEAHGKSAITLPLYPAMTDEQQDEVINALKVVL